MKGAPENGGGRKEKRASGHAPFLKPAIQGAAADAESSGCKAAVSSALFEYMEDMPFFRQIEAVAAVIPEQFRRHMERVRRGGRRACLRFLRGWKRSGFRTGRERAGACLSCQFVVRGGCAEDGPARFAGAGDFRRQPLSGDESVIRQNDGALDHVAQFPHIARP